MCLTGVDYFSTLGYQPSIAFEATGLLAPLATIVLILVTLFGALPVYRHVASKSVHGGGSIAMLEALVHGWTGKIMVLALLGFAATDFVITKTLSAADAAEHILKNPLFAKLPHAIHQWSESQQRMALTMLLLIMLGATFLRGFKEAISAAVVIVGGYLALNLIVIGGSLCWLVAHPELIDAWRDKVARGDWHFQPAFGGGGGGGFWVLIGLSLVYFPKLALGLSGFETGVAVMPLILGDASDDEHAPHGRIRNTRRLLLTAALIMSALLMGASIVTTMLIQPEALEGNGPAANRALAYIAHGEGGQPILTIFGEWFGTIYDISTVLILGFAGASAMAGLLNLVPQYLPRYGMAPEWARAVRPLVMLLTVINLGVTWLFNADVKAQAGAYATGVLVLMSSACVATFIDHYRANAGGWLRRIPWVYGLITIVFFYTTGANIVERPEGLKIASFFILAIAVSSLISRAWRSTELRFDRFQFVDLHSKLLWDTLKHLEFPVLVPHRPGRRDLEAKENSIRQRHRLGPEVPIVFIEAELGDPSEFTQTPQIEVVQVDERFVISVRYCASIAHAIAALALELSKSGTPPEIHFGWSHESPLAVSASFLLFGEGNVPWMVRELLRKAQPDSNLRPRVVLG